MDIRHRSLTPLIVFTEVMSRFAMQPHLLLTTILITTAKYGIVSGHQVEKVKSHTRPCA